MKPNRDKMRNIFVLALGLIALALLLSGSRGARAQQQAPVTSMLPPPQTTPTPAAPQSAPPTAPATDPTPAPPSQNPDDIVEDLETVRVESNLVVVPVSVIDAAGQPVQGLTVTDFRLSEEGRAQEITQVGSPEQVPLEIAILLDVSSSVSKLFEFEQQAATRFLKQVLKPTDKAAVFTIDEDSRLEQGLASAEIASARLMMLKAATKRKPTAFYDTVVTAARYLAANTPERHRRVIVVISDGEDNVSRGIRDTEIAVRQVDPTEEGGKRRARLEARRNELHTKAQAEVLREVQRADVVFYSINPSGDSLRLNKISQRAQDGMQRLADETGGTAFAPNRIEDLEAVFRQIAAELRAQYLLQYYSSDESPNGRYLRLKVSVPTHPQHRIRARQGYYVKRKD